ncbi:MAG: CPBP family intramembrane glutamic endopeptidase [Chloroflexota bacterium]
MNRDHAHPSRLLVGSAWAIMLLVSLLPNILWHELAGGDTRWLFGVKVALLAVLVVITFFWKPIRPLRNFILLLLVIYLAEELIARLTALPFWQGWFGRLGAPFTVSMLGIQLGRLLVSLLLIGVLLALGYRRADFFLVRGQVDAPIEPVRWLGFPKPEPWTRFGGQWVIYISLGLLAFLILGGRPSLQSFVQAAPMLPVVLLLAAMNAFNEELTYRSTLLASLEKVVGAKHALWNAAVFFGIAHYFGVPYGIIGVVMATFLGWMLGKAMFETRGFFWAWLIHLVQDVLIFSFMAAGSITPGG